MLKSVKLSRSILVSQKDAFDLRIVGQTAIIALIQTSRIVVFNSNGSVQLQTI